MAFGSATHQFALGSSICETKAQSATWLSQLPTLLAHSTSRQVRLLRTTSNRQGPVVLRSPSVLVVYPLHAADACVLQRHRLAPFAPTAGLVRALARPTAQPSPTAGVPASVERQAIFPNAIALLPKCTRSYKQADVSAKRPLARSMFATEPSQRS